MRAETKVLCFLETFQRDLVFNPKPGWRFFFIEAGIVSIQQERRTMFQLSIQDIHPGEKAGDKEEAIRQVAAALVQAGNVAEGYVNGMLAREQQTLNVPRQWYCYSTRHYRHPRSGAENRRSGISVPGRRHLG